MNTTHDLEERNKILERISQLLNMANDVSSPAEAAIAARRARALMDKHQVTAAEVAESEPDEFDSVPQGKAYRFMPVWKNVLATGVGQFNDCQTSLTSEYRDGQEHCRRRMIFKGYRSDVIVAGIMYEFLIQTVDRLCSMYIAKTHPGLDKYPAKIGDAYKKGASIELCARFRSLMAERDAAMRTSTGSSLIVIKNEAVEAEFGTQKYTTKSMATKKCSEAWAARHQGAIDARGINLSSELRDETNKRVGG